MDITLQSDQIRVRKITQSDIASLLVIYQNPINMRFIPNSDGEWTAQRLKEKLKRFNADYDKGIGVFAVETWDGKLIGEAGLFDSFKKADHLELGYIIDHVHWGKGYGAAVCKALMDYGFNQLYLSKLTARMYQGNIASVRLSQRCGMKKVNEGIANDWGFYEYEMKREDWLKLHC
ncbi:GNAT family N-acetyltransferase [Persicobacter psychrovividus]|uniref:N-acetyltransferase domain-containing protein n=1 Tax=Persicobacter psychrovividus TaxID=387638 RepID=A0ABM7VM52_9BACT|nr:hypothetical protein PEPS_42660 [Persicobacter psychrovividus]